ncbi:MAG TPA: uridine kinase [Candidatus Sulfomarinibacteraceae bacterium]|nr:uridine kinase [Candidatus Sulfomarinibacteraceae bacterium]
MASQPLVIGVAGGTGSGKTTVAEALVGRVGAERIVSVHQDRYYRDLSHLDPAARAGHNFDHPDAIEEELLVAHLRELRAGRAAPLPVYDFTRHLRTAEVHWVEPRPVILVEGILVLAVAPVRSLLDVKLFVDTDADLRLLRRLGRDLAERGRTLESVVEQYLATVRPMHLEFVEPSKRHADLVIPEGGHNTVALDLIVSHIRARLDGRPGTAVDREC